MEQFLKKYHKLFFLAVAVWLLYPVLQKGHIFILDWELQLNISWADIDLRVDSLSWFAYKVLAIVFSFGVAQRMALFATVYFLGLAGFRLAKRTGNVYAQYFSGLLLIFNPFVYARLIEQPGIAFGSLFFFWFLVYFLEYLEERSAKKIILTAALAGLTVSLFAHGIFFVGSAVVAILFFEFWKNKDWRFSLKTAGIIFFAVILLNANWLGSFLFGSNQQVNVAGFGSADWEAFDTNKIGGDSIYTTVLAMQGYWGEFQDRFVSIRENPLWRAAFWLIFLLAVFGLIKRWKKDYAARAFLVMFVVAYVLAIGVASPIIKPLAVFLYEHVPFYIGLREPQKWVVVLVFVYAYLAGWGVKYFLDLMQREKLREFAKETGIFLAILPVIFSFSIVSGMHKHFQPRAFPIEWQEAKNYLDNHSVEADGKILIFPWHLYLKLDFAGKNVNNPAKNYFGQNVIQAKNTEFGKVYTHSIDERTKLIEKYVIRKDNPEEKINYENFVADMQSLEIEKIILLKAEDWQKYSWLDRMKVQKVLENGKLVIYEISAN